MRWTVLSAVVSCAALVGCHRDDPPRAVPDEHVTGPVAQVTSPPADDDQACLSHGKATTPREYQAIAQRVTRRVASLAERFPALDGLELDDLHGPPEERHDAVDFALHYAHGVAWEKPDKPEGGGPGKLKSMTPTYQGDDAIDLSISFFTGPDLGRLMVPLVAIGEMNTKLMVLAPRAEELTAAIRAILVDEARRFAACS